MKRMINKRGVSLLLSLLMVLGSAPQKAWGADKDLAPVATETKAETDTFYSLRKKVYVEVDGFLLASSAVAELKNGQLFIPMRELFESLGATVSWDPISQTITVIKENKTVTLTLNEPTANINNSEIILENPPYMKVVDTEGYTMIPLRVVSETFNATVQWDMVSRTASITTGNKPYAMEGKIEEIILSRETPEAMYTEYEYKRALEMAIENNSSIANLLDAEEKLKVQREDIGDAYTLSRVYFGDSYIEMLRSMRALDASLSNQDLQKQVIEESLAVNLKSKITTINIMELQLYFLEESLLVDKKDLETLKLKNELGLATAMMVKEAENKIAESELVIKNTALSIRQEMEGINELLGLPTVQLSQVQMYEKASKGFDDLDLAILIADKISNSPNIIMNKRAVTEAEYNKELRERVGYPLDSLETEADLDRAIYQAKRTLKDSETAVESAIRNSYRAIETLNRDKEKKELEKVGLEDKYKTVAANYKAGYVTFRELEKVELAMLYNAIEIQTIYQKIEIQLHLIQYPYLGLGGS